jgi:non-canonical purine NTP pyrophosphatase (RdgB/HAM1 family)
MALPSQTLLIATRNAGKAREFAELLGPGWKVETLADRPDLLEGEEDGVTFEANAAKKAILVSLQAGPGVLILADDSGLEVDALDGAPGVYSARYAGEPKDDARNNAKLLAALAGTPAAQRGAQFRCSLCLAREGEVVAVADGICRGSLIEVPRGSDGFGYDPLFVPEGGTQTFAEMGSAQKHALSHRGKAMAAMAGQIKALA